MQRAEQRGEDGPTVEVEQQPDDCIFTSTLEPHSQRRVGVLTLCHRTLCAVTDRGRKVNLEEPIPFNRVFIQAEPV